MLSSALSFQSNQSTDVSAFKNLSAAWPRFLQSDFYAQNWCLCMDLHACMCVLGFWEVLALAVYPFPGGCSALSPKGLSMKRGRVPPGLWGLGMVGVGWQVSSAAGKNVVLSWDVSSVLARPVWHSRIKRVTSLSCCHCVPGCSGSAPVTIVAVDAIGCWASWRLEVCTIRRVSGKLLLSDTSHRDTRQKILLLSSLLSVIYTFTSLLQIQNQCHVALEKD